MKITIPIPGAEIEGAPYAVEFDAGKITGLSMPAEIAAEPDGRKRHTGLSKLILEFGTLEDTPQWVQADREAEGPAIRRRPLAGQLRYLAGKLREGGNDTAVSFALDVMADEAEGEAEQ